MAAQGGDETQRLTAELLRAPLERFTTERTALVRQLRAKKQMDVAREVAALRKPSVVIWALNQAGAIAAHDLDAVRSAATVLSAAQARVLQGDPSAGGDLRSAAQAHRRATDTLTRRLGMVLSAAGHAASDDALRRIGEALRAASLAGDETWSALVAGRLLAEPAAATFSVVEGVQPRRVARQREVVEQKLSRERIRQAEAQVREAESTLHDAREQEMAATGRRRDAERALAEARAAADALRES